MIMHQKWSQEYLKKNFLPPQTEVHYKALLLYIPSSCPPQEQNSKTNNLVTTSCHKVVATFVRTAQYVYIPRHWQQRRGEVGQQILLERWLKMARSVLHWRRDFHCQTSAGTDHPSCSANWSGELSTSGSRSSGATKGQVGENRGFKQIPQAVPPSKWICPYFYWILTIKISKVMKTGRTSVHTSYMEPFVEHWKWIQNTEKWEYLYWKTGEQLGGTAQETIKTCL